MSALPADDERLIDVPDLSAVLKREWPRLLNRAVAAILLPVAGANLLAAMRMIDVVAPFVPGIWFLLPSGTLAYAWRVMAFLIFVLVVGAFFLRERTGGAIVAIALAVAVAASFNYSALHWTELFEATAGTGAYLDAEKPAAAATTWAVVLFGAVGLFLLAEATFDARRQQAARGLPDDETRAVAEVARLGIALAAVLAALLGGGLLAAFAWLDPLAREQLLANRLNPVVLLLGLGIALAVAVVLAARRARVGAPGEDERAVRVPVQGPAER